jgi:NAD-dependent SIR2 family protein deacetylase
LRLRRRVPTAATSYRSKVAALLGAGASAEAGIPVSGQMIHLVEKSLDGDEERALYDHVKSAIHFSAGLKEASAMLSLST